MFFVQMEEREREVRAGQQVQQSTMNYDFCFEHVERHESCYYKCMYIYLKSKRKDISTDGDTTKPLSECSCTLCASSLFPVVRLLPFAVV